MSENNDIQATANHVKTTANPVKTTAKKSGDGYQKAFLTIGITGFAFFLNYLITLVLTPYITDSVGTEAYGFVTLAKNMANYATMVTAALTSFAVRFISLSYHHNDMDEANTYFSSVFYGCAFLGGLIFVIGLVGIVFLEKLLSIPPEIVSDVKFMFLFVFIKFLLVTFANVFQAGEFIKNKLTIIGIFKIASYVVEALVLIGLFGVFKPHVFYVGIGLIAAALIEEGSHVLVCRKYTPELKIDRKKYSFAAVKELVVNGIWSTVNSLGSFLHNGLDLFVCNLMISPLAMGQLAISDQMHLIFSSIILLACRPFHPMYLKSYADGNEKKLLKQIDLSMKTTSLIGGIIFAGFTALGLVFYKLWIPNQDIQLIYQLSLISSAARIPSGIMSPVYYAYTLALKKKVPAYATIISGAANVISMYFLIKYTDLGVYAVVLTTAVIMTILNFVFHALYSAYALGVKWWTFYPAIIRCMLSTITMTGVFMLLSKVYMPSTWITLILTAIVYAIIGCLIHFVIGLNREQKSAVLRICKNYSKKIFGRR